MHPANILVIEDNPSDVYVLRKALRSLGEEFEMEVAADGDDALAFVHGHVLKKPAERPCVILMDLHLPKRDGLEVLQALRAQPALQPIPLIVVTNLASQKEKAELHAMGIESRPKPNSLKEFTELAKELVALCKGSHAVA